MAPMAPVLDIQTVDEHTMVEAHVRTDAPREFAWRLTVSSAGEASAGEISHAGQTDGADRAPVARVAVNTPGVARLTVTDRQGRTSELSRELPGPARSTDGGC